MTEEFSWGIFLFFDVTCVILRETFFFFAIVQHADADKPVLDVYLNFHFIDNSEPIILITVHIIYLLLVLQLLSWIY